MTLVKLPGGPGPQRLDTLVLLVAPWEVFFDIQKKTKTYSVLQYMGVPSVVFRLLTPRVPIETPRSFVPV